MIVDSSALLAVVLREQDWETFAALLIGAPGSKLSAANLVEVGLKLVSAGASDPNAVIDALLEEFAIRVSPVDAHQARVAVEARLRFGRGRHPAGLNYGDCFAYALAKTTGEPLLYKGGDFARTDVLSAL